MISGRTNASALKHPGPRRSPATSPTRRSRCTEIEQRHGRIDILVNSAGTNVPKRHFEQCHNRRLGSDVSINLSGRSIAAMPCCRRCAREGRADDQRLLLGRPLYQHADRAGLQRDQTRRDRALGVRSTSRNAPTAFAPRRCCRARWRRRSWKSARCRRRRRRANAAGGGPRPDASLSRHPAGARLRQRDHHQPDLEPLLVGGLETPNT